VTAAELRQAQRREFFFAELVGQIVIAEGCHRSLEFGIPGVDRCIACR
jgi:hypothetical protein